MIFSMIDMFFCFIYSLYNFYYFIPLMIAVIGYYGGKHWNKKYILCNDSDNQIKVASFINDIKDLPGENEFLFGYRNPRNDPLNRIIYSKFFKLFHD